MDDPVFNNPALETKRLERLRIAKADEVLRQSRKKVGIETRIFDLIRSKEYDQYKDQFSRIVSACKHTKMLDYPVARVHESYQFALLRIASYFKNWIREPETWVCRTKSVSRQLSSLSSHLFVKFPVPKCMDNVWFQSFGYCCEWYILLAQGHSVRKLPHLPIPLTKNMAHWFTQAPPDISPIKAIRWGQIMALGGDDRLAKTIIGSRIGDDFQNNDFWESVIRFFINNPMIDHAQVSPIIDFINAQKFEHIEGPPPHPNFCMKGRTVQSIMQQMSAWHRDLGYNKKSFIQWESCGIPGAEYEEGTGSNRRVHVVREILNSKQLQEEGREMHHCVASYVGSCKHGRSAIYSLATVEGGSIRRRLTIELRTDSRIIVQARGKFNALPEELDKRILKLWTTKSGIEIRI
jgi:hypothetical protein